MFKSYGAETEALACERKHIVIEENTITIGYDKYKKVPPKEYIIDDDTYHDLVIGSRCG